MAPTPQPQAFGEDELKSISRAVRDYIPLDDTANPNLENQLKDLRLLFENTFLTCSSSGLGATHRVAAWNTLCSLIDQTIQSNTAEVVAWFWDEDVLRKAFGLYLDHAQTARPKSSRQLLVTLTNALRKCPADEISLAKEWTVGSLLNCLSDYQSPHQAKASAQLLGHLLSKDVLNIMEILPTITSGDISAGVEESRMVRLLETVFRWLIKGEFGSTVATLVAQLVDKFDAEADDSLAETRPRDPTWALALEQALGQGTADIDVLRAHILPMLFKRNFYDFYSFLQRQGLGSLASQRYPQSDSESDGASRELLYAALSTSKDIGVLRETAGPELHTDGAILYVPISWIGRLLVSLNRSARLTGLSLLVNSPSATIPFSRKALRLLRRALNINFADVDADFRGVVFGAFQRLVDRIRAITASLARNARALTKDASGYEDLFHVHKNFLLWSTRFLTWELRPTASYQRHISALRCLSVLSRSGLDDSVPAEHWSKSASGEIKWPFHITLVGPELRRMLLDLLMDPFDDVRQTASAILGFHGASVTNEELTRFIGRAETLMLSTGRADHADGVARLHTLHYRCGNLLDPSGAKEDKLVSLVERLEHMLGIAEQQLSQAVQRYPLHGLLTAIRYILAYDSTKAHVDLNSRLFQTLEKTWETVKPILCDDAPEGYAIDETEDVGDSTKETLSYCWRALKESSLLLGVMVEREDPKTDAGEALKKMSDLCFTQLAELRHRGAFSTVAQTWAVCCMRCGSIQSGNSDTILVAWYRKVLEMLRNNILINTRRSGGMPFLLCGILIADKSGDLLGRAFADLENIARSEVSAMSAEEGSLCQVHAMNCVKDMLKNTRLGELSERYIPSSLRLAADSLRSDVWAIRNCGLMLFRAVIDRLLGTDQSHFDDDLVVKQPISVNQYPELLQILLGLLETPQSDSVSGSTRYEGVFPALQLLGNMRVPEECLSRIDLAVSPLISSPSWHVRDKAARTLAALARNSKTGATAPGYLGAHPVGLRDQNAVHGIQLVTRYNIAASLDNSTVHGGTDLAARFHDNKFKTYKGLASNYWAALKDEYTCALTRAAVLGVVRQYLLTLHRRLNGVDDQQTTDTGGVIWTGSELQELLSLPLLRGEMGAVLQQMTLRVIADHLALAWTWNTSSSMVELYRAIAELVAIDPDAGADFLDSLVSGIATHEKSILRENPGPFVSTIITQIFEIDHSVELRGAALRFLLAIGYADSSPPTSSSELLGDQSISQVYADQWFQYHTWRLAHYTRSEPESDLWHEAIVSWAEDCAAAVTGDGIFTREAVASSISLWTDWGALRQHSASHRLLCIAIYDLLHDDDEELRLLAAEVVPSIVCPGVSNDKRESLAREPLVASQILLAYSVNEWLEDQTLSSIALERAFGIGRDSVSPVANQLDALSQGDTTLFAEEKQNLYIDDACEVRAWSQVLQRLSPRAISSNTIKTLSRWVMEGLRTLIFKARDTEDGALGWTSKAEMFCLGLQVVYGAEALLTWVRKGVPLPIRPSSIRRELFECLRALVESVVNPLWCWEIERVLAESVVHKVTELGRRMTSL